MSPADIAWLAGILEGEACFDKMPNSNSKLYPRVRLEMKDRDIVERVKALVGGGGAVRKVFRKPPHADTYRWQLLRREVLEPLLRDIRPYLGERRGVAVDSMLALWE